VFKKKFLMTQKLIFDRTHRVNGSGLGEIRDGSDFPPIGKGKGRGSHNPAIGTMVSGQSCDFCLGKRSTPDAQGVINLTPHEFLSRLADLGPPPRKHRHRNTKVFAPNHPLRPLVTAMAIGSVALLPRPPGEGRSEGGSADPSAHDAEGDAIAATRSHDTSRIAWAKLLARA